MYDSVLNDNEGDEENRKCSHNYDKTNNNSNNCDDGIGNDGDDCDLNVS